MQLPIALPEVNRHVSTVGFKFPAGVIAQVALTPQDCNLGKKIICGSAVAACIGTPNPVACILAVAPNCVDCL